MTLPLDAFYTALASTCGTSLPLARSLSSCGRPDLALLADGRTLAEILEAGRFPAIDVAVVRAAEASGRLEAALKSLARRASEAKILRRKLTAILVYPMFVAHGVVIAPWIIQWIVGRPSFVMLLCDLAAIWILFFAARAMLRSPLGERLPVAGPIRRGVALARFCDTLSGALDAALPNRRAIELAADAAGGGTGARARVAAAGDVNRPLVEILAPVLPPLSIEMLRAGEESGNVDKALANLSTRHFEDAIHALNVVVAVLPVVLFLFVVALAVLQMMAIGLPTGARALP
ncbi:MAG: type II secretion system F family protein [Planctomycetes bacterium]|nr:type II secretion system F family protein [Planctomycetota bacterium]